MTPSPVRLLAPLCLVLLAASAVGPAEAQSLRGSRSSVNRMYEHAVDHGLYFYNTGSGLREAASDGKFVRISSGKDFVVRGASYPYVQPATLTFVERLAAQYRAACGERLVITSAARPRSMRLANSVARSVHPTGMAIDLRKPRKRACGNWLRETLLYLEDAGVIEATEEYTPPHFHVAVYPNPYLRYVRGDGGPTYASASASAPRRASSAKSAAASAADRYRVRSGDSLWTIARRHDTSVARLKQANNLRTSRLRIGQTLVIPGR